MKNLALYLLALSLAVLAPEDLGAGGACTCARFNNFKDHGCHNTPGGAGSPPSGANNAGGNTANCPTCQTAGSGKGMPEWWVDEPYINLHVVDEPLSYTTATGQDMGVRFYYKQRYMTPQLDQIPTLVGETAGNRLTGGRISPFVYDMRGYGGTNKVSSGMTNAAWAHNWMMNIIYWDDNWERTYIANRGNPTTVFSDSYEALVFRPEGDISYFTYNAGNGTLNASTQTNDFVSKVGFSGYPHAYPGVPDLPAADAHGIYWGSATNYVKLTYPDGSQDIFGLGFWNSGGQFGTLADTTANAFLTQKVDPQGRVTKIGYEHSNLTIFRVKYVVDSDGRTNTFLYPNTNTWSLQEIDDPFGRRAAFSYYGTSNWLASITDTAGNSNSFSYPFGFLPSLFPPSGWMTSMTTPYGTTSFSYYQVPDSQGTPVTDAYEQIATLVSEPEGAHQFFYYDHKSDSLGTVSSTNTVTVSGVTFDNGSNGGADEGLYHRNSFYWDRMQCANISIGGTAQSTVNSLGAADLRKARMQHWLLGADGLSITETVSSVRDPSPDPAGGVEGNWTWYGYGNTTPADTERTSQVAAIGRVTPDGANQYVRYKYYSTPVWNPLPWVSENDQSYSKPDGSLGEVTSTFGYAANGIDLTNQANSFGQYVYIGYNSAHEVTTVTNALGQVAKFGYGGTTLTSMTLSSGKAFTFSYNSVTPITTNSSFLNQVTIQPEGLTENITDWTYGLPRVVHTTGTGLPDLYISNSWDKLNRLTGTVYQDGSTSSNIYLALDAIRTKDRAGNWTSNTFDGLDHLAGVTNALGYSMSFDWCGCGSLKSVTDFTGTNTTYFNLNNQELVTNVVYPDGSSYTNQFDLIGRLTTRTDGAGKSWSFKYNNQNLITNTSDAYGTEVSVVYDPLNRPTNVTDIRGVVTTNGYDLLNELIAHGYAIGSPETYTWASNGLVKFVNLDGQPTYFGRDDAGRVTAVTNALSQTNALAYNALDEVMSLTDGNGHATQWGYNQWGWLTSKTNAHGTTVAQYAYDGDGRVTTRTLAGVNTTYNYDALGNLKAVLYPGTSNVFSYDADSRLASMSNGFGSESFGYTGSSQLQGTSGSWGSLSYVYNQGRRTGLTLGAWSQSYGYDNAWRMTGIGSPAGSFAYGYAASPSPLPSSLQLPNGAAIGYAYDSLARLTTNALANYWGQIIDGESCGRDLLGLPTNIVRNLGMTANAAAVSYDAADQIVGWSASESGTNRLNEQLKYQYDAAGNLITRTNNALVETFSINPLNEVSTASHSGSGNFTFAGSLPEPASRITVNGASATQYADLTFAASGLTLANGANTFTVLATNKYGVGISGSITANLPTTVNFQCDTNGNLTSDGALSYQYDAENRLTNVYLSGQWQVGFIYDALGRRRSEQDFTWSGSWVKTNEVRFVYDGLVPIQELDSNNSPLVTYTRGLDLSVSLTGAGGIGGLLSRTATNGSTFYHSDLSGNITTLIDQFQHVVARAEYDPFGRFITRSGSMVNANRYWFSSKEFVSQANIYNFGWRFYTTVPGRWLNQDPIGESGGANLYGFCGNDPLLYIDPWGFIWYDDLGNWVQNNVNQSKNFVNNNLPPVVAAAADTALDLGGGLGEYPQALGHLGEGSGTFSADPSLANAAGVAQDLSVTAGTMAAAFENLPSAKKPLFGTPRSQKNPAAKPCPPTKGSTANRAKGTTPPRNLREQLAIEQAAANPAAGQSLKLKMTDPRWPASAGWQKMQQVIQPGGDPINVHYVYNPGTGEVDDLKIVLPGAR